MIDLSYRPLRYRDRWLAYFDLLGFSELVSSHAIEHVLPVYEESLHRMQMACDLGKKERGLLTSWFSDTFIIYTRGDTLQDFAHLESAARIFFEMLLMEKIPVRGCISHGKLYSQAKHNVFIGPALIEAHRYGEALNWVGLCLAPSVEARLRIDLPLNERLHYRQVHDTSVLRDRAPPLYAFAYNSGTVNGKNPFRQALVEMRNRSPAKFADKYQNALAFLDRFA